MGKRILLLKQETIGLMFQPRSDHALIVRICGPDIPKDAKTVSFAYIAEARCFAVTMVSAEWSDMIIAGSIPNDQQINGIMLLPNAPQNFHITVMPDPPVSYPPCAIEGFDQPIPISEAAEVAALTSIP